jgi:hypothetical protein
MDISLTPDEVRDEIMNKVSDSGAKGQLEGDFFEEQVFNSWKSFLSRKERKNIAVIQGWKREWTNLKQEPKPKGAIFK